MDQIGSERLPVFGLIQQSQYSFAYKSKSVAVMSLLLHLLFNIRRREHSSWTFNYLEQTRELVLIMPVAKKQITCEVVGTLFRNEKKRGTKVYC